MKQKLPRRFIYFLGAIFLINLIQSAYTELIFDEAYYWYYAQNMSWGYFDHPPLVALLIKLSSLLFNGELGVRFFSCLLSVGTIILLWLTVDHPKKKEYIPHFFILVFSMALLNAYGFLTLPDTPLLFFTALFLWIYKKFLQTPSVLLSLALGLVMAALMYSKYHAVLVILFVILSNYKLLLNKYAWLAVVLAFICYIPHINWLVENNFVTLKYHLFERPNRAYHFEDFTLGFFINLIALFGLTFPWIYWALWKSRATDKFTRALLFLVYGVLVFFFVSSFHRRVQTQWIIVTCIPMVILVYNFMLENTATRKWIFRIGIANIAILCFLRIGLVYEPFFPIIYETHGNKKWVAEIESQVGNVPVIFENSYRNAPMYSFYSGNSSYSLNNIRYRQNQYSIDSSEYKVQGKRVWYTTKYTKESNISFTNAEGKKYYGNFIQDFESFRKLRCTIKDPEYVTLEKEQIVEVYNPYVTNIDLKKIRFAIAYLNDYKQVKEIAIVKALPLKSETNALIAGEKTAFNFQLPTPRKGNPRFFKVCISENGLYWGINGDNVKLP